MFDKLKKRFRSEENMLMTHNVYISYSSMDKEFADEVCQFLENNDLKCWIAPRNICAGRNYVEEIIDGIKSAKVAVLIFSRNSNASKYVCNEIRVAFERNMPIFALNIDESFPSDEMEFYLGNVHWIVAWEDKENALERLVEDIKYRIYDSG